jgi:hypothetical protein
MFSSDWALPVNYLNKMIEDLIMKFISDKEYEKAKSIFFELESSPVDVYETGDREIIRKFEDALNLCIEYEQQCYGQKLNMSPISAYRASIPKRATFPITRIF